MNSELQHIIDTISKGETSFVESFFKKPGGRKYLENITLILINSLPNTYDDKEELYLAFVEVLNKLEKRIKHQQQGQRILQEVFE